MARSLSVEELLCGAEPSPSDCIEGAALVKLYWTLKDRFEEMERQGLFWQATNSALKEAYEELELRSIELRVAREQLLLLNSDLERRVQEQVTETLRRAQEVEALNSELQRKALARSRELLLALERLPAAGSEGSLRPGDIFAERVEILSLLGRGGMGVVYLGNDLLLRRPVALKLLSCLPSPVALKRFLREVTAAALVTHPAVVRALHVDVAPSGQVFQILEYIEGMPLSRRLVRGPLPQVVAARLFGGIAEALSAAHASGVIHRDIKPSNILLCSSPPYARLLDFGISKLFSEQSQEPELTGAHEAVGTPRYMAPEQICGSASVTTATDIYSFGAALFEAVTGRSPYPARTVSDLVRGHMLEQAPDLRSLAPDVTDRFAELVASCLEKDPAARPSARSLAAQLSEVVRSAPPEQAQLAIEPIDVPTVQDLRVTRPSARLPGPPRERAKSPRLS